LANACWLDLFTGQTWNEFLENGGTVSGFRQSRWNTVSKMKPGDYLLCYLTGISRWIGLLEITISPFKDEKQIWSREIFPCRLNVKPIITLTPETAIPVKDLKDNLSYFQGIKSPNAWTGHFRSSPIKEKEEDANTVIQAMEEAANHPIVKAINTKKLLYQPKTYNVKGVEVTIPEKEEDNIVGDIADTEEGITHEEIQWLLLRLGQDLGLELWVAKNDKNKSYKGQRFGDFIKMKDELPVQFDAATNKTIELIDILWLRGNAIEAAFEVEHTTSIYSGLLRMSDLVTMQSNLNIALYIVAPDNRRDKVFEEINRPTFSRLKTPLSKYCKFIPYSSLKKKTENAMQAGLMQYLKPEFINEIAEPCIT
jgi:predicted RNA-binding protein